MMEAELTDKQKRFIEEYLVDFNGAAAARRAGYSEDSARFIGYENLTKPYIIQAINERLDVLSMSAGEATKRLTDWGRGSMKPFLSKDDYHGLVVDLSTDQAAENAHLIKKIKQTKRTYVRNEDTETEYTTEIELHDAKDAVVQIAKIRGLYVDRVEHSGKMENVVLYLPDNGRDEPKAD